MRRKKESSQDRSSWLWSLPWGWVWISVLWCFPGWGGLCLCSDWWSGSHLSEGQQCPVVGLGCLWVPHVCGQSSWPRSGGHVCFCSHVRAALSGYPHCSLPPCPWDLCWCFCPLVPPCTAGRSLLGRGFVLIFSQLPSPALCVVETCVGLPQHPELILCVVGLVRSSLCTVGLLCAFLGLPSLPSGWGRGL